MEARIILIFFSPAPHDEDCCRRASVRLYVVIKGKWPDSNKFHLHGFDVLHIESASPKQQE
jgi:hypothetical protein